VRSACIENVERVPGLMILLSSYSVRYPETLYASMLKDHLLPFRDFTVPPTLSLQLSKSPTDVFYTSYALDALPRLNGSVSYVASEAVGEVSPRF
jgi:distribution and morphology protein 10